MDNIPVCVTECWHPQTSQYLGRIFHDSSKALDIPALQKQLRHAKEEDRRFNKLRQMLQMPDIQVTGYPEADQDFWHIYYTSSVFISNDPVFAFVLVPFESIEALLQKSPYYFCETPCCQVENQVSPTNRFLQRGNAAWIRRVFPDVQKLPLFYIKEHHD